MGLRRIHAQVATTHAIPAYGGIRLSENAIRQMAEQLASGAVPMRYHHDAARPASARNVTAGVEQMEDGELAAWVEFDIDEDEWELYEQERQRLGAPGGFSPCVFDRFASRGNPPFDIEIGADASYFEDDFLVASAGESIPAPITICLGRLYQFTWVPDPKILLNIAELLLINVPPNLLSSYLYDLAQRFKSNLSGRARAPVFEMRVRRTPRSHTTLIKIATNDDQGLRDAIQQVPEILRAEGATAYWDTADERFKQVDDDRTSRTEAYWKRTEPKQP